MTTPNRSILVATDLSSRCDRAVDRALALALQLGSAAELLHVVDHEDGNSNVADVRGRIVATLASDAVVPEIVIAHGAVPETIGRIASERGSAVIVTGVARMNDVGDYFLGTAVDHIVRYAQVPVLVVKQRSRRPYSKLLVATDLSDCSRKALVHAAALFPDAELHLVYAYHVPFEGFLTSDETRADVDRSAQRQLDAFSDDPALPKATRDRVWARIGYGDPCPVVEEVIGDIGADLVVIGTHGRSGFARATIGSQAEAMLTSLSVDTLLVRDWSKAAD